MPLETKTIDLTEEIAELERERDTLATKLAEADPDSPATQELDTKGQQKDRYIAGLTWYLNEYDSPEIEVGALTNGERHQVRDTADEIGSDTAGQQNAYVAMGTVDAGYLVHEPGSARPDRFKETIGNVADLHPAFVDWIENEITGMGRMSGEMGKSFRELAAEKRKSATSGERNG